MIRFGDQTWIFGAVSPDYSVADGAGIPGWAGFDLFIGLFQGSRQRLPVHPIAHHDELVSAVAEQIHA